MAITVLFFKAPSFEDVPHDRIDYGWPEDLDQSQWDSSEMFDVSELLGDLNEDIFTDQSQYLEDNVACGLSETEKQQVGLYPSYGLPPLELGAQDGNEFFDMSFLDLQK
ncbi:hypothetical protein F2Q70_00014074 [Brassica cretica]|uniref:Uncharacterized protein n=1 Tax=Brassica cretica TaxID=69181 RepID=A0A8S9HWL4_BRACR|nr:hypothetical protein F2Q70_00014074 [Brassica cretica]